MSGFTCCAECYAAVEIDMIRHHANWHRLSMTEREYETKLAGWVTSWESRR